MYCPNCGQRLMDGAKYCTICGTQIDEQALQTQQQSYEQRMQAQQQEAYSNYDAYAQQDYYDSTDDDSPHPETLNSLYAWLLAFIPGIVGMIASTVVLMNTDLEASTYQQLMQNAKLSFLVMIPTIVLLALDGVMLKRSNYRLLEFWWIGFLLMPAYLFIRAYKTNKKYGYAIAWCVVYGIEIVVTFCITFIKVSSMIPM